MALIAHLQFGDNDLGLYSAEYKVKDCHFHFTRHHNHFRPDTDAQCEQLELVVVAPGKEDLALYEWYIGNGTQSGRILFDEMNALDGKTVASFLAFEDAYCYSIEEEYHIDNRSRRCLRLSIAAEKMVINDVEFKNLFREGKNKGFT